MSAATDPRMLRLRVERVRAEQHGADPERPAAPAPMPVPPRSGGVLDGIDRDGYAELDESDWELIEDILTRDRVRTMVGLSARALRLGARIGQGALVASVSVRPGAMQPWRGVIGVEGRLTGDGRFIQPGALSWATLPLPLRVAPADYGGHDGAVPVGRIDRIERRPDGLIYGWGSFDLGSEVGVETVRLIRAGVLSGVSMDLDSTDMTEGTVALAAEDGGRTTVKAMLTTAARVRAATMVAIPAFDEARIELPDAPEDDEADTLADLDGLPLALGDHPEDCGCERLTILHADDAAPSADPTPTPERTAR